MVGTLAVGTDARGAPCHREDQEAETLGQVHLAYEAGNVLSIGSVGQEEMVVVVGYGDEAW